jgi:hypothetical protein
MKVSNKKPAGWSTGQAGGKGHARGLAPASSSKDSGGDCAQHEET